MANLIRWSAAISSATRSPIMIVAAFVLPLTTVGHDARVGDPEPGHARWPPTLAEAHGHAAGDAPSDALLKDLARHCAPG